MFGVETLVPVALFLSLAFTIVGVTKIISDGRTRRRLLEAGASPELARTLAGPLPDDPGLYSALRWGLILGAVGLALIVVQFLPFRSQEPIVLGIILLFTAAALLGYYRIARRLNAQAH
jgi:hypothetical protein